MAKMPPAVTDIHPSLSYLRKRGSRECLRVEFHWPVWCHVPILAPIITACLSLARLGHVCTTRTRVPNPQRWIGRKGSSSGKTWNAVPKDGERDTGWAKIPNVHYISNVLMSWTFVYLFLTLINIPLIIIFDEPLLSLCSLKSLWRFSPSSEVDYMVRLGLLASYSPDLSEWFRECHLAQEKPMR